MIKEARGFGSTIDEAKENAIAILNPSEDDAIDVEIITMPKKKTLGLFGGHSAEVRVFIEVPDEKPKQVKKPAPKTASKPAATDKKPAEKRQPKAENKVNKESNPKSDAASAKDETKKSEAKPVAEKAQKAATTSKKYDSVNDGYGEKVDSLQIPADSQAGKAVAYLNSILEKLGCTGITMKVAQKDGAALIELEGEGLGVVIGRRGETLDSLQYLAGLAANNGGGYYKVSLNIGNYREKREETLVNLATRVSDQVLKTGKNRTLEPMNPYERRIIHTTVQDIEGVVSASFGEGSARRVVIAVEGSEIKPQRHDGRRREGFADRRRTSRPPVQAVATDRTPKKDSDIPLYGKIN